MEVSFSFYGAGVRVEAILPLVERLRKDFSFFSAASAASPLNPDFSLEKSARRAATHLSGASGVNPACPAAAVAIGGTACEFCSPNAKFGLNIRLHLEPPDFSIIPEGLSGRYYHPEFVLFEDKAGRRYIDYQGEALACFSRGKKEADIYSASLELLHEIAYLAVLSVSGEAMEKRKYFRMHGLSLLHRGTGIALLAPTGCGKTSIFLNLLKEEDIGFYSDDIVLVDRSLRLHPFPLRIGIRPEDRVLFHGIPERYLYTLERRKYGSKHLLDSAYFSQKIAGPEKLEILFVAERWNGNGCKISPAGRMLVFRTLFRDLVVGLGLPQLVEYLNWKISLKGALILSGKLARRLSMAIRIVSGCRAYRIFLGRDSRVNSRQLLEFLGAAE